MTAINGQVKKSILFLNHHLPDEKGALWVTAKEMRDRLVHSGVHHALTLEMVESALKSANRGQKILRMRMFHKIRYFIPTTYPDSEDIPSRQRFKKRGGREQRIHINPVRHYFQNCEDASTHLVIVNTALEAIAAASTTNMDTSQDTNGNTTAEETSADESESEQSNSEMDFETEQSDSEEIEMEIDATQPASVEDEPMYYEEPPFNGNIIMDCDHMDDFIREATCHSARCGRQLRLIKRDTTMGAAVKEVWLCPACGNNLTLLNCKWTKTTVVEPERKFSRIAPSINMKIAQLAAAGVNQSKILKSISEKLGIKISNRVNLAHQTNKVRAAIAETAKSRIMENRREHVALTRSKEDYQGDIEFEMDGEKRSVCVGEGSGDGGGCTRSFNHKHKGKQSLYVVNSKDTKKPLAMVHSQVSCCHCLS